MEQAPFGHNRTSPGHNSCYPAGCQVNIAQQNPCMNGKVRHSLLCLLNQCIPEDFPRKIFRNPFYFFPNA